MQVEARKAFKPDSIVKLIDAAKAAETIVKEFGVLPSRSYGPHLDIREFEIRSGGLSLHDGNVPLRQAGLGTRRLVTMSLQHNEKKTSARPTLIDEVEHGLEPHRLRRFCYGHYVLYRRAVSPYSGKSFLQHIHHFPFGSWPASE